MFSRYKSVSPLIATILLIVVSVIIVTIILIWGKSFVSDNLFSSSTLSSNNTDRYQYIRLTDVKNGRFFFNYSPPHTITDHNFTITSYTYNGGHVIPLPEEKTITSPGIFTLDLGIVDTDSFYINLILDNNSYLPFNDLTTNVFSPSKSDCPDGYIPVPGNHLYGTVYSKGGFCVAKYEMKMDRSGDGLGDLVSAYPDCIYNSTQYNVWDYSKAGCSTGTIVSTPQGSPITMIPQSDAAKPDAIEACESLGDNYHLITNNEWMTLARNIEMVPENWSSGEIGSGYIYSGHNDNGPARALEASIDDTDSYYGTDNTTGNQRRTLTLTNGQIIWDLPGNVWEWTDDTIQRKNQPDVFNTSDDSEFNDGWTSNYVDYSKGGGVSQYLKYDDLGNTTLKYKDLFLLTSSTYKAMMPNNTTVDTGIGRMYTYSNRSDTTTTGHVFMRGGHWHNGTDAGLLALRLLYGTSTQSYDFGFRCAVVP